MHWRFVARTDQLDYLSHVIDAQLPGPVVLSGEPGIGRTSLLTRAMERIDRSTHHVIRIQAAGPQPFAALSTYLPAGFVAATRQRGRIAAAAAALAGHAEDRRAVLVLDDAHHADQATMQVLRELHRRAGAVLLLSAPTGPPSRPGPDPLDCLRYEPGARTLMLPPLSVDEVSTVLAGALDGAVRPATSAALHAASGGNPRLLRDLVTRCRLTQRVVRRDGGAALRPGPAEPGLALSAAGTERLLAAVGDAWRDLAVDRTDNLCLLASWTGLTSEVATIWATVLLLRGRAEDGIRMLDAALAPDTPRVLLVRALLLGLGLGRVDEAAAMLTNAARSTETYRSRLLGYRAWLLAATGRPVTVESGDNGHSDREAVTFWRAARAVAALVAGRAAESVAHVRRALVAVESLRDELPWLPPYLTACLIDGLLLAGRINEATTTAAGFHAGNHDCGWNVAVSLAALLGPVERTEPEPVLAAGAAVLRRAAPPVAAGQPG